MSPRRIDRDGDRGQLIIVAGIGLAVTLVVLALILNSVIYTGNLATRDIESGANDATKVQSDVKTGLGGVMDGVNDPASAEDYSTLESNFETGTEQWRSDAVRYSAVRGHALRIPSSGMSYYHGLRLADETSGTYHPRTGTPTDWVVAPDVRARSFTMTADGGLASELAGNVEGNLDSPSGTYFYTEIATDSGPTWRIAIYEDSGTSETAITVFDSTDPANPSTCLAGASANAGNQVVVDVGDATVNGRPCPALDDVGDTDAPYSISYWNPASISGTWDLTVDWVIDDGILTDESNLFTDTVDTTNYGDQCSSSAFFDPSTGASGSSPFVTPALYSGTVSTTFESQSVKHAADIRLADRELSQGTTAPRFTTVTIDDDSDSTTPRFIVDWDAIDPNGDFSQVTVELRDSLGSLSLQSATSSNPSGPLTISYSSGTVPEEYQIWVTVTDTAGNSRTFKQTHQAEDGGDDSGCPP